jgi:hypothetical protein
MAISRIETFNPIDMSQLLSDTSELSFGGIVRGNFCAQPVVIKPVLSGTITQLAFFLESTNGYTNSQFSYLASKTAFSNIQAGGPQMSNHFIADPGVSDFTTSDIGINLDPTDPEYIWLDAKIGLGSILGAGTINYRFVFEFN